MWVWRNLCQSNWLLRVYGEIGGKNHPRRQHQLSCAYFASTSPFFAGMFGESKNFPMFKIRVLDFTCFKYLFKISKNALNHWLIWLSNFNRSCSDNEAKTRFTGYLFAINKSTSVQASIAGYFKLSLCLHSIAEFGLIFVSRSSLAP